MQRRKKGEGRGNLWYIIIEDNVLQNL